MEQFGEKLKHFHSLNVSKNELQENKNKELQEINEKYEQQMTNVRNEKNQEIEKREEVLSWKGQYTKFYDDYLKTREKRKNVRYKTDFYNIINKRITKEGVAVNKQLVDEIYQRSHLVTTANNSILNIGLFLVIPLVLLILRLIFSGKIFYIIIAVIILIAYIITSIVLSIEMKQKIEYIPYIIEKSLKDKEKRAVQECILRLGLLNEKTTTIKNENEKELIALDEKYSEIDELNSKIENFELDNNVKHYYYDLENKDMFVMFCDASNDLKDVVEYYEKVKRIDLEEEKRFFNNWLYYKISEMQEERKYYNEEIIDSIKYLSAVQESSEIEKRKLLEKMYDEQQEYNRRMLEESRINSFRQQELLKEQQRELEKQTEHAYYINNYK